MKKLFALVTCILMIMTAMVPAFAAADKTDGFVKSIGSYTNELVVIDAGADSSKDIVAIVYDKAGKEVRKITRAEVTFTSSNDKTKDATSKITEKGGIAGVLPKNVVSSLKKSDINADALVVAAIYDFSMSGTLADGEYVEFSVKNPAFSAISKAASYAGKSVVFQMNEKTGKYEAISENNTKDANGVFFTLEGDVLKIRTNHLCVFAVAAESYAQAAPASTGISWVWILVAVLLTAVACAAAFYILLKKNVITFVKH